MFCQLLKNVIVLKKCFAPIQSEQFFIIGVQEAIKARPDIAVFLTK